MDNYFVAPKIIITATIAIIATTTTASISVNPLLILEELVSDVFDELVSECFLVFLKFFV